MEAPARRAYLLADTARSAEFYGVAYRPPSRFPLSAHRAARLFYVLEAQGSARARNFGRDVFTADRLPMLAWRLDQTAARAALYSKSQS